MNILVVVDMQNDFITGALGTAEAAGIVENAAQKIREHEGRIVVTQDTHGDDYLTTQEGRHLPVPHCIRFTEGWQLHPEIRGALESRDGDMAHMIAKLSFGSMDLAEWLVREDKAEALDSIELIGVCTDICVITNALIIKTSLPEVPLIVDASCCAGVTPESHQNALEAMKMCQIKVVNHGKN